MPSGRFNQDESLLVTGAIGDHYVRIWDFATGELIQELYHEGINDVEPWVWNAQFLNNDTQLIVGYEDRITLWDWRSEEIIWSIQVDTLVQDIAFTSDEKWFVVALNNGSTRLYHTATGTAIRDYIAFQDRAQKVDMHPDDQYFVTTSRLGTVVEWPLWWEGTENTFLMPIYSIRTFAKHPTLPLIAFGMGLSLDIPSDGKIYIMNIETGEIVQEFVGHEQFVSNVTFSPDGRYFLSSDEKSGNENTHKVFVWGWEKRELLIEFAGHTANIYAVAVSADNRFAASSSASEQEIFIWDIETGEILYNFRGHNGWVIDLQFSSDGKFLYSSAQDGKIFRWNLETGEKVQEYADGTSGRKLILVTKDNSKLVSGRGDYTLIWDTESGEIISRIDRGPRDDTWVLSPDEILLAIYGREDGVISLYDFNTGEEVHRYTAYPGDIIGNEMVFSQDGKQIIVGGAGKVIVFNIPDELGNIDAWIRENRHMAEFTCEQRALYRIEPLCEG